MKKLIAVLLVSSSVAAFSSPSALYPTPFSMIGRGSITNETVVEKTKEIAAPIFKTTNPNHTFLTCNLTDDGYCLVNCNQINACNTGSYKRTLTAQEYAEALKYELVGTAFQYTSEGNLLVLEVTRYNQIKLNFDMKKEIEEIGFIEAIGQKETPIDIVPVISEKAKELQEKLSQKYQQRIGLRNIELEMVGYLEAINSKNADLRKFF